MFSRILPLVILAAGAVCSSLHGAEQILATPKRVLFFSKSAGFEHSVIKREGDKPSYAENVLSKLSASQGFDWTLSKDGRIFTTENIAKYDAFVFLTTGDLTKTTGDGQPAMTPEGKEALLEAVQHGKGFVGVHCASDTFHTPGSPYVNNDAADVDPFIKMLGGEFITHDKQQKSRVTCADGKFPGMAAAKDGFEWVEEWYSLKNFAPDLHVLLVQHTEGMEGNAYHRPAYPATWARLHGEGRVFYTSLAHREDTWDNPKFQEMLMGGIHWAARDKDADITPNLAAVCPEVATNPPDPKAKP